MNSKINLCILQSGHDTAIEVKKTSPYFRDIMTELCRITTRSEDELFFMLQKDRYGIDIDGIKYWVE